MKFMMEIADWAPRGNDDHQKKKKERIAEIKKPGETRQADL